MSFWVEGGKVANTVWSLADKRQGMAALRALFPDAEVDSMNFVLFSTSGVHGTYLTIEDVEEDPEQGVTFLVIQPRLVLMRYGVVYPENEDDFEFLKRLRRNSQVLCLQYPWGSDA